MTKFDLIIFGAGPIGLTLANLLGKKHFKILVIDKTKELVFNTNRYIAISNKTNKILNQDILKKKIFANQVKSMQLYNESFENKNKLDLSSETICSIVNATELHKELYHECCKQNNITICLNSKLKSIVSQNELVELTTTNDKKFNSNYLFVSDGKKSQVKEFLKLEEKKISYNSTAYVFEFSHSKSNNNSTYQLFQQNCIAGLLPLSEKSFSCVLSINNKFCYKNDTKKTIDIFLKNEIYNKFGKIKINSEITSFPLTFSHASKYSYNNVILIGDSAHSFHPLAGMGMNVGFSDVLSLVSCFEENIYSFGSDKFFNKYDYERHAINQRTIYILNFIEKTLTSENRFLNSGVNRGFNFLNKSNLIKRKIINFANNNLDYF